MNTIKPIANYIFTFAKDDQGNDIKYRFMLTINKNITKDKNLSNSLLKLFNSIDGINYTGWTGNYTIEIQIARTFNPDEVIDALKKILDQVLSDIIVV